MDPTEAACNEGIIRLLSPRVYSLVRSSKILLIGSGGIGCELIKNLAMTGFTNVTVIDLDTIDVSNLNRQFLFRSVHVGSPKCVIATAAAPSMSCVPSSSLQYTAHHANVKDTSSFPSSFFLGFDAVLNALDNVDARRHVNRMCLTAGLPLVEAGTTGYLGQVTVIHPKSGTECYECQAKPAQKVYPICTIRSTPSQPVHCIVWAKEVFKLCFGDHTASMLFEEEKPEEGDAGKSTFMGPCVASRPSLSSSVPPSPSAIEAYVRGVVHSLMSTEISKQIAMDRYKTSLKAPTPLDVDAVLAPLTADDLSCLSSSSSSSSPAPPDRIWTKRECYLELVRAASSLLLSSPPIAGLYSSLDFDKDSNPSMRFVAAAAVLRCEAFGIPPETLHGCKGIAGNIVPAIATTNAIVAGLQVLELVKVLVVNAGGTVKWGQGKTTGGVAVPPEGADEAKAAEPPAQKQTILDVCKFTYCLRDKTRRGLVLQPTTLPTPNPDCFVCRSAQVTLTLKCGEWNLSDFVAKVLKGRLAFCSPIIQIGTSQIYEDGEEEYDVNLPKKLVNLPAGGIKDGASIVVEDFTQALEVVINVREKDGDWTEGEDGHSAGFTVEGGKPKVRDEKPTAMATDGDTDNGTTSNKPEAGKAAADDDGDDLLVLEEEDRAQPLLPQPPAPATPSKKRLRGEEEAGASPPGKKSDCAASGGAGKAAATAAEGGGGGGDDDCICVD